MKALNLTDGYKVGHASMFPDGTSLVFNNLTSRCVKARESLYRSSDAYREKMRNKYAKNKIHDKRN